MQRAHLKERRERMRLVDIGQDTLITEPTETITFKLSQVTTGTRELARVATDTR